MTFYLDDPRPHIKIILDFDLLNRLSLESTFYSMKIVGSPNQKSSTISTSLLTSTSLKATFYFKINRYPLRGCVSISISSPHCNVMRCRISGMTWQQMDMCIFRIFNLNMELMDWPDICRSMVNSAFESCSIGHLSKHLFGRLWVHMVGCH